MGGYVNGVSVDQTICAILSDNYLSIAFEPINFESDLKFCKENSLYENPLFEMKYIVILSFKYEILFYSRDTIITSNCIHAHQRNISIV